MDHLRMSSESVANGGYLPGCFKLSKCPSLATLTLVNSKMLHIVHKSLITCNKIPGHLNITFPINI